MAQRNPGRRLYKVAEHIFKCEKASSDEWRILGREAELAAAQIALGITALGRADHRRLGDYATAFFGLANGLERLGKLIVITDYAIKNHGKFPTNDYLKDRFRHDLNQLLDACEAISTKRTSSSPRLKRPNEAVHRGIVQCLNEFAKLTRYYNLDFLTGGQAARVPEPVGAWWKRVGEPILSLHYKRGQREKDRAEANRLNELMDGRVSVLAHSETGDSMNDITALVQRAGATRVVQKYGRLYVLQIVRWLSYLISDLAHAAHTHRIGHFLGLEEPFGLFLNDDDFFRRRKTWAIYP